MGDVTIIIDVFKQPTYLDDLSFSYHPISLPSQCPTGSRSHRHGPSHRPAVTYGISLAWICGEMSSAKPSRNGLKDEMPTWYFQEVD